VKRGAPKAVRILGSAPLADTGRLSPNPLNDNRQSPFMYGRLKASILTDGFADPIVVRSGDGGGAFDDGRLEIIGGEHRWRVAKDLGMSQVPVHDLGSIDDLRARKLLLTLNRIRGESDQDKLSRLLREINADGGTDALASLPFDDDALTDLLDGEFAAAAPEGDGMGDEHVPEVVDRTTTASERDLLAITGVSGLKGEDLRRLLDAAQQWAFSREDLARPVWEDLLGLFRRNTRLPPP
jgi:hypothetical protein